MDDQEEPEEELVEDAAAADSEQPQYPMVEPLTEEQIKDYKRHISIAFGALLFQGIGCIALGALALVAGGYVTVLTAPLIVQGVVMLVCAYFYKARSSAGALYLPIALCVLSLILNMMKLIGGPWIYAVGAFFAVLFSLIYINGYKARDTLHNHWIE